MSELLPNLEEQKHAFIADQIRGVYTQLRNPHDFLVLTAQIEDYAEHVAQLRVMSTFISSEPKLENGVPNKDMLAVEAFIEGEILGLTVASCYLSDGEFACIPLTLESIRFNIGQNIDHLDEASEDQAIKDRILAIASEGDSLADYYQALIMDYFNRSTITEEHVDDFCNGFEFVMAVVKLIRTSTVQSNSPRLEIASQVLDENDFSAINAEDAELN